jgi:mono/diheme cytochrome c family protein
MLRWLVAFALFATFGAVLTAAPIFARAQEVKDIGKAEFKKYCAGCHGIDGKGDGPFAKRLKKKPADLTQIRAQNSGRFPVNKLFNIIDGREQVAAHGPRVMPVWGKIFKERDISVAPCKGDQCFYSKFWRGRILAIIEYIETLQEHQPNSSGYW